MIAHTAAILAWPKLRRLWIGCIGGKAFAKACFSISNIAHFVRETTATPIRNQVVGFSHCEFLVEDVKALVWLQVLQSLCAPVRCCACSFAFTIQMLRMQICLQLLACSCSMLVLAELPQCACSVQLCKSHMQGFWANDHMFQKSLCKTTIIL
jgi:hypothetical protein